VACLLDERRPTTRRESQDGELVRALGAGAPVLVWLEPLPPPRFSVRHAPERAFAAALAVATAFAVAVVVLSTCASSPRLVEGEGGRKYPSRRPGCELRIYGTPVPPVAAWDDLGVAEAACHINSGLSTCIQALKAEACRMGGDIIYNVPRHPYRPRDQVMVFRGQVAHTRGRSTEEQKLRPAKNDEDAPPPATAEEAAGPVVPLTGPGAAPVPAPPTPAPDGGTGG
jgi:hypothetical protein